MRHCYICDGPIAGNGFRRTVKTGSSARTYYGRRISWSRSRSEGLRTVCQSCAERIDRENRIQGYIAGTVFIIVAGLFLFGSTHKNDTNPADNNAPVASVATSPNTPVGPNPTLTVRSTNDSVGVNGIESAPRYFKWVNWPARHRR